MVGGMKKNISFREQGSKSFNGKKIVLRLLLYCILHAAAVIMLLVCLLEAFAKDPFPQAYDSFLLKGEILSNLSIVWLGEGGVKQINQLKISAFTSRESSISNSWKKKFSQWNEIWAGSILSFRISKLIPVVETSSNSFFFIPNFWGHLYSVWFSPAFLILIRWVVLLPEFLLHSNTSQPFLLFLC